MAQLLSPRSYAPGDSGLETESGTVRQMHYFRMQYHRPWRWWSLAGAGAVTGPQSLLSKYNGCC